VNPNYFDWLESQLKYVTNQVKDGSIAVRAWAIVAVIEKSNRLAFVNKLQHLLPGQLIKIDFFTENEWEYQGIKKVWEIGQRNKGRNDIILYYHSKGVTRRERYDDPEPSLPDYNIILKDIKKVYRVFDEFPHVNKVGFSCSKLGWMWYNFWYARGSYINNVEKPIKTNKRHYYEFWLGRKVRDLNDVVTRPGDKERPRRSDVYETTFEDCYSFDPKIPSLGVTFNP